MQRAKCSLRRFFDWRAVSWAVLLTFLASSCYFHTAVSFVCFLSSAKRKITVCTSGVDFTTFVQCARVPCSHLVYADTSSPASKHQLVLVNFARKRELVEQFAFAFLKEQKICIFKIILSLSLPHEGVFRELWPVLVWKTCSRGWTWKLIVFFSMLALFIFKSVVKGSGRHFIMMTQILSAYKQVNNTASSLL